MDSRSIARKGLWVRFPPAALGMYSPADVEAVLELAEQGLNNCQIARQTGISRTTVRDWRCGRTPQFARRYVLGRHAVVACEVCGHPDHADQRLPESDYAYLLGQYLGDGFLATHPRRVFRLRISVCTHYPGIVEDVRSAMTSVMPRSKVVFRPHPRDHCGEVSSFSKQWICLFPQHGPGRKHERLIELEPWQVEIVDDQPEAFLRGLIHSDGCRAINTVRSPTGKTYSYPRYHFTNASDDIRGLFCRTCDQLGIEWRRMNARNISVARRASVARLDEFVGPKR